MGFAHNEDVEEQGDEIIFYDNSSNGNYYNVKFVNKCECQCVRVCMYKRKLKLCNECGGYMIMNVCQLQLQVIKNNGHLVIVCKH